MNFSIYANNIFNQELKEKKIENISTIQLQNFNSRSIGATITWIFGKRFPTLSAGNGASIANDIKN
ncbi:MAG: hypothetical protein E6Q89_05185 [Bacteroidia bacterium]|nr:MAG: hypothetical protein E6Q89_05185 [Bacteroidia bacterium]